MFSFGHTTPYSTSYEETSVNPWARPAVPVQRPRALLFVNNKDTFAGVCAWCPDKQAADAWCERSGFIVTHTICPTCRALFNDEAIPGDDRQVA